MQSVLNSLLIVCNFFATRTEKVCDVYLISVLFKLGVVSVRRLFWGTQLQAVSDCSYLLWAEISAVSRNRTKQHCQLTMHFGWWVQHRGWVSQNPLVQEAELTLLVLTPNTCLTWAIAVTESRSINLITIIVDRLGPSSFSHSFSDIRGITSGLTRQHLHETAVFPIQILQVYNSRKHIKTSAEDLLLIRFKKRRDTSKIMMPFGTHEHCFFHVCAVRCSVRS